MVVLPAPLGPSRPTTPGLSSSVVGCKAVARAYFFETPSRAAVAPTAHLPAAGASTCAGPALPPARSRPPRRSSWARGAVRASTGPLVRTTTTAVTHSEATSAPATCASNQVIRTSAPSVRPNEGAEPHPGEILHPGHDQADRGCCRHGDGQGRRGPQQGESQLAVRRRRRQLAQRVESVVRRHDRQHRDHRGHRQERGVLVRRVEPGERDQAGGRDGEADRQRPRHQQRVRSRDDHQVAAAHPEPLQQAERRRRRGCGDRRVHAGPHSLGRRRRGVAACGCPTSAHPATWVSTDASPAGSSRPPTYASQTRSSTCQLMTTPPCSSAARAASPSPPAPGS